MKSIKTKEEEVLAEFKKIVLFDKDGNEFNVPVLYAGEEKTKHYIESEWHNIEPLYMSFRNSNALKLPVISLNTKEIGYNNFVMEGVVHTLYRDDMNKIIEQFHHQVENDKIGVSSVTLAPGDSYASNSFQVQTLTGRFTVEYRE